MVNLVGAFLFLGTVLVGMLLTLVCHLAMVLVFYVLDRRHSTRPRDVLTCALSVGAMLWWADGDVQFDGFAIATVIPLAIGVVGFWGVRRLSD